MTVYRELDQKHSEPNQLDLLSNGTVYMEPFETVPVQIQTDPKLDLQICTSSFRYIWICSAPIPEWSHVNRRPIQYNFQTRSSLWIYLEPVLQSRVKHTIHVLPKSEPVIYQPQTAPALRHHEEVIPQACQLMKCHLWHSAISKHSRALQSNRKAPSNITTY